MSHDIFLATRVQILNKAFRISQYLNTLEKVRLKLFYANEQLWVNNRAELAL